MKGCCRAAHKRAQDAAAGKNHAADMACDSSLHLLQDEGLLPACHERVGIALRLDSVARSSAKKHADKKWMASAAADLGALFEYQRSVYQSVRYVEETLEQNSQWTDSNQKQKAQFCCQEAHRQEVDGVRRRRSQCVFRESLKLSAAVRSRTLTRQTHCAAISMCTCAAASSWRRMRWGSDGEVFTVSTCVLQSYRLWWH